MRPLKKLSLALGIILCTSLLASLTSGQQTIGCCCDPVVKNGSFASKTDCDTLKFIFAGTPQTLTTTCSQHCSATLGTINSPHCGDTICQVGETTNCPQDCAPLTLGCGSPILRPAPQHLVISPVPSEKALALDFSIPCPTNSITIQVCPGSDCTNFKTIAELPPTTHFVDQNPNLEFNKDYTYQVIAHYSIFGDSQSASAIGNLGDLECWHQTDTFCVSPTYYDQFTTYLTQFGYDQFSPDDFTLHFELSRDQTFSSRYSQAWKCTNNHLTLPLITCANDQYCIADEKGPRCITPQPCPNGDPFGLFNDRTSCESTPSCFFDRSSSPQNKCYSCNPAMHCIDYISKGTCERDPCSTGDCSWKPLSSDIGTGVCIDKRTSNCGFCSHGGILETANATSTIFEGCNEDKARALSTSLHPCFYDKDLRASKTCEFATCKDYTQTQCSSPTNGIKLAPDNHISSPSTDPCSIGVCEYHDTTGCIKNADGNSGAQFQDCKATNKTCEQDYFPPITTIIPSGPAGKTNSLTIQILDQTNATSPAHNTLGTNGYITSLCLGNCNDARSYTITTTSRQLILKNKELKDGKKTLATLNSGNNTIYYYTKDPANNVEVVKQTTFLACNSCNGPTILNTTITGGRLLDNTLYTSALLPTITFTFDEPTEITAASLTTDTETIPLQQLSSQNSETAQFTPTQPINGTYTLAINGRNNKNIYISQQGILLGLVVDTSLAELTIEPNDGSIINETKGVQTTLHFTSTVTLSNITLLLESYSDPFVKTAIPKDVTTLFSTTDNQTFSALITNVTGGKYTLLVLANGFNGLAISGQSRFFVATQKPSIILVSPAFGTTPYSLFNATVETPLPSTCVYVYNTPSPPSSSDFDFLTPFTGSDALHTASGLQIPYGIDHEYLLHAYCKFNLFGIVERTFPIILDPEPPTILRAFAEPATIAEQYIPNTDLFVTTLKTELDKNGFCKYSAISSDLPLMEGTFLGFDFLPKQSHTTDISVTDKKTYTYTVVCKGKNQLTTQPATINFTVDLSLPLNVTSSTPQGFSTTNFTIGVVANKRVFCYFGEQETDTTKCMGACKAAYTQSQQITVASEGTYTYYVKCSQVNSEQTPIIAIPVIIDTTKPEMDFVNDDSLLSNPNITWNINRIRVSFKGHDDESKISHYLISLQDQKTKQNIFKDFASTNILGEPSFINSTPNGTPFKLANDHTYQFSVKAVNTVGLVSDPILSDGVLLDVSQTPQNHCADFEQNQDETDLDCGGTCNGCNPSQHCTINSDCATNFCKQGICTIANCSDSTLNGAETDIDCGSTYCNPCSNEKQCLSHTDCASGYCDLVQKTCTNPPPCADKHLSIGESDIDCGGPCEKCTSGKTCASHTDCANGLSCDLATKTCTANPIGDKDGDGILDDKDNCPNTPNEETSNAQGCSLSQTFSVGDTINDAWRIKYFNCTNCPEAAGDSDPDSDSLINRDEFLHKTNPTLKDTDSDWWNDGTEIAQGFDPLDPTSHPSSIWKTLLWTLFILLALSGITYGGYLIMAMQSKKQQTPTQKTQPFPFVNQDAPVLQKQELAQLRTFAKQEDIPNELWIPLEKEIKKKPIPPSDFDYRLEKLKTIIKQEQKPLLTTRSILAEMTAEKRQAVLESFKKMQQKKLTQEETTALFSQLHITATYYQTHSKQLEMELKKYGKR